MSLGFVFPGQGAQQVGMAADFAESHATVRELLAEANDALGFDLAAIIAEGPADRLSQTEITQPALLTVSVAFWRVWVASGGALPEVMAGHSLGEYSALTCAGSLAFGDAVRLVNTRGKLMQKAVPAGEGTMAAILGLDDDKIVECCEAVDGVVQPANLNAPGQTVISGATPAVRAAVEACTAAGARRAVLLDVSGPFHSSLMHAAAEQLEQELANVEIRTPEIAVVHNVDAEVAADPASIRSKLLRQLDSPVRWADCVASMIDRGVDRFVECGPGKVLAGLSRRIDKSVPVDSIGTVTSLESALT